jgi:hypothetical protein
LDDAVGGDAEMAKHAVGCGATGANAGGKPHATVRRTRHRDVAWQRARDSGDARQVADEILRDRRAEALNAEVDRLVTQRKSVYELAMDGRRELAVADCGLRRASFADERLHDHRIAAQVVPFG